MSLQNPVVKMSKSEPEERSRINLNDPPNMIRHKINQAKTDGMKGLTYDPVNRPGITNLLRIEVAMRGEQHDPTLIARKYADAPHPYKLLKNTISGLIVDRFAPIGERFEELMRPEKRGYLAEMADLGAKKASEKATRTMGELRKHLGMSDLMG